MDQLLRELLEALEKIGAEHEELYDSEVRVQMSAAILNGFISPKTEYVLPASFGMYSEAANSDVRIALAVYIDAARSMAHDLRPSDFHGRLSAFQKEEVATRSGNYYDDFFGYWNPANFDAGGNALSKRG
jgi:hypothetical protein